MKSEHLFITAAAAFALLGASCSNGSSSQLEHSQRWNRWAFLRATPWDGQRPSGYSPVKKEGAIVLGTGGDGSLLGTGMFFEGAITIGCPDDKAIDDAIQANIVAAGYGK